VTPRSIPYGRQYLDEDDIAAVISVMRGDWLTQGPTIDVFEEGIAERVGARHAVAFSSGTAGLHAAAAAADLGPGDTVVTSPLTFMASANCARYVGAAVGLVDIDLHTWNMDLAKLPPTVDAVVAVHYAGLPADLRAMSYRPRVVIEDAAHALGAHTPDGPVGNCAHSDMCVFSFHPVKPITTGEGGIVTTNDDGLAEKLRRFRTHGIVRTPEKGGWSYTISELGFNYRMTDVQAALGLSQLSKLSNFIDRRNEIAQRYRYLLAELPVTLPPTASNGFLHGYHLFPILTGDRKRIFDGLRESGIGVQVHYVPIHHHPISASISAELPNCDAVYEQLISIPIYPALADSDQDYVVQTLRNLL
jgi:UDP-4-amino-4,6-dideoxy-N-acetyl-beta-L-altrosamine transaminase